MKWGMKNGFSFFSKMLVTAAIKQILKPSEEHCFNDAHTA